MPTNMQQIKLSIPEPCHQNWQQMTPTQQGRFCNACAKQVIDFSAMSDAEVLHYFSNIQSEKVCGRAYADQLERTIALPVYPKKKLFWYWNYITMFFLFFSKSNNVKAQGGIKVITEQKLNDKKVANITTALQGRVGGMVITSTNVIRGKIIDNGSMPIAGASVMIKGAQQGAITDLNGFYRLNSNTKDQVLEISAVGFEKKEVKISNKNAGDIILTQLENISLGEIVIVGGMMRTDEVYTTEDPKHIIVFEVNDNASLQPVSRAAITISKGNNYNAATVYTDKKGIYKLKKISEDETYTISITAAGYKTEELKISASDADKRKMIKQIFLEKEAVLSDYKKMNAVVVTSYGTTRTCSYTMGSMISGITIKRTFADSLNMVAAKILGTIKISPSPVQSGNSFNLSLKLKETGLYKIQITDASGRIVLVQQINAILKSNTQQVQTNAAWSSGIYYLSVMNDKNILLNTVSFSIR